MTQSAFGIEHPDDRLVEKSFREGFRFGRQDVRDGVADGLTLKASRRDTHRLVRSVRRNRKDYPPGNAHSLTHHAGARVGAASTRLKKADARTRRLGQATGATAGGALAARGVQAGGAGIQTAAYTAARGSQAAKGSFSSEKARALRPHAAIFGAGLKAERLGRRGSRGLALGAAGLGTATAVSAAQRRRGVAKSAGAESAFGIEH